MKYHFYNLLILLATQLSINQTGLAQSISIATEVRTEIVIEGTPEQIWELLIDFERYPDWHPYLQEVTGTLKKGAFLKFKTKNLAGDPDGKFRAKVLVLEPPKELAWGGNALFFFRAKHYFRLEKIDETHTLLIQGEYWKGIFGKLYGKNIYEDLTKKFILFNRATQFIIKG